MKKTRVFIIDKRQIVVQGLTLMLKNFKIVGNSTDFRYNISKVADLNPDAVILDPAVLKNRAELLILHKICSNILFI